jgi:uroporphyrinogen decarboxylase
MQEMTAMQRMMKTLNHEEPDRVPVVFLDITICAREAGVSVKEYCLNAKALVEGQLNFLKRYRVDALMAAQGVAIRAEAFGAKVRYYETAKDSPVIEEPAVKKPEDWETLGLNMKAPGISALLEASKILRDKLEDKTPIIAVTNSPLTLATQIGSMAQVMKDIRKRPDTLHRGLRRITDLYEEYIDALCEVSQLKMFWFVCARASAEIVTEKQYREFGVPYDLKVLEQLKKRGIKVLVHVCGPNPFLDLIASEYPVEAINWWDRSTTTSLSDAKERFGDKVTLVAGLDQTRELLSGTPEQVEAQAKDAIRQAAKGGGFMLSGGCEISAISPPENIHAAVRAAETYGKYPINL